MLPNNERHPGPEPKCNVPTTPYESRVRDHGSRLRVEMTTLARLASGEVRQVTQLLLDPARVRVWSGNARSYADLSEASCRELIDSITAEGGQKVPAVVRRVEGDPAHDYEVIAGTRRHCSISWLRADATAVTLAARDLPGRARHGRAIASRTCATPATPPHARIQRAAAIETARARAPLTPRPPGSPLPPRPDRRPAAPGWSRRAAEARRFPRPAPPRRRSAAAPPAAASRAPPPHRHRAPPR